MIFAIGPKTACVAEDLFFDRLLLLEVAVVVERKNCLTLERNLWFRWEVVVEAEERRARKLLLVVSAEVDEVVVEVEVAERWEWWELKESGRKVGRAPRGLVRKCIVVEATDFLIALSQAVVSESRGIEVVWCNMIDCFRAAGISESRGSFSE
jgi:hypothetical protein